MWKKSRRLNTFQMHCIIIDLTSISSIKSTILPTVLVHELQPLAFEWHLTRGTSCTQRERAMKWCTYLHKCDVVCNFRGPLVAHECYFQNYCLKRTQKYRRISLRKSISNNSSGSHFHCIHYRFISQGTQMYYHRQHLSSISTSDKDISLSM